MNVYPSFLYKDPAAAIGWLEQAFGAECLMKVDGPDGSIAHAELRFGNGIVMLGGERDDAGGLERVRAGTGVVYISIVDPDAHHDRARAAGARITRELVDTDYGSRDYACLDPEGNLWNFGTYDPAAQLAARG